MPAQPPVTLRDVPRWLLADPAAVLPALHPHGLTLDDVPAFLKRTAPRLARSPAFLKRQALRLVRPAA